MGVSFRLVGCCGLGSAGHVAGGVPTEGKWGKQGDLRGREGEREGGGW